MDIFKLGDKILALLQMVFGFWNNQVGLVFSMLGQSPVNFKGGGPWQIIEGIEPVFVGVGASLVVLFFVIGMVLTIVGWKMTGELLGLGLMLVGIVFLLTALLVYNALYKK